jgi:hypothetical protein
VSNDTTPDSVAPDTSVSPLPTMLNRVAINSLRNHARNKGVVSRLTTPFAASAGQTRSGTNESQTRTTVRDPRKTAKRKSDRNKALAAVPVENHAVTEAGPPHQQLPPGMPLVQTAGGSLGTYFILGAGVSFGFALVGALFGGGF